MVRTDSIASMTRRVAQLLELAHLLGHVRRPARSPRPCAGREGHLAGQGRAGGSTCRTVDPDDADPLPRGEMPGHAIEQRVPPSARPTRPAGRRRPCPGASAGEARPARHSSRGGGSAAISALAASIRNFGLLVRAGAPGAARPTPCASRLSRRSAVTAADAFERSALAPGRMPRTHPRRPPPRRLYLPRLRGRPRRGTSGRA
jgi:hypothetical protein